jgi:hypothetical protein
MCKKILNFPVQKLFAVHILLLRINFSLKCNILLKIKIIKVITESRWKEEENLAILSLCSLVRFLFIKNIHCLQFFHSITSPFNCTFFFLQAPTTITKIPWKVFFQYSLQKSETLTIRSGGCGYRFTINILFKAAKWKRLCLISMENSNF